MTQSHIREIVCDDCMAGDHRACRREGGYMDDEDNEQRCGCHLTSHALDNRVTDDAARVLAALLDVPPERRLDALAFAAKAFVESVDVRVSGVPE